MLHLRNGELLCCGCEAESIARNTSKNSSANGRTFVLRFTCATFLVWSGIGRFCENRRWNQFSLIQFTVPLATYSFINLLGFCRLGMFRRSGGTWIFRSIFRLGQYFQMTLLLLSQYCYIIQFNSQKRLKSFQYNVLLIQTHRIASLQ